MEICFLERRSSDRQDAQHILRLLLKDDFPRIWVASWENRDLRQLLWHRHRMVQTRTRIMNQLQAVALNEGLRWRTPLAISEIAYFVPRLSAPSILLRSRLGGGFPLTAARYLSIHWCSVSTIRLVCTGVGISSFEEHPVMACSLR
jgi:hypothetical protein